MYSTQTERIGKVTLEVFRSSYRLRFRYGDRRYSLTVGKVSSETYRVAKARATQIDLDLMTGHFDDSLAKYDPKKLALIESNKKKLEKLNLRDIWENYKAIAKNRVAETTQRDDWQTVERCLKQLNDRHLKLENSSDLLIKLLDIYSPSTVKKFLAYAIASTNFALEQGKADSNPYKKLKQFLPSVSSDGGEFDRTQECFTRDEIRTIIEAFKNDIYCPKVSSFKHNYYAPFIQFLSLTGMRPGEVIALTWDDVTTKNGTWIKVTKSYSKGVLKETKTGDSRLFPVNNQLLELINSLPKIENENNLIFPSIKDLSYINQQNFSRRYWRPIVLKLWNEGKISKYLPTYNLRHSFITKLIQEGIDPASIAKICGTSTEMIFKHYLAARTGFELPEI